jgi:hypothetical protein
MWIGLFAIALAAAVCLGMTAIVMQPAAAARIGNPRRVGKASGDPC